MIKQEVIQINKRILVLNEDIAVCEAFQERMQNDHTIVMCVQSVVKALDIFIQQECCLAILDLCPSEQDKIEMLRIMHNTKHTPILTLIPNLKKEDRISLFQAGADVCLDKTTDIEVCVAQAKALMRLYLDADINHSHHHPIIRGQKLIISPRYRQVMVDGIPVGLTRKEFDLLHYLASHPEQVFSSGQLYRQIWNEEPPVNGNDTVKVHIGSLRKKISDIGRECIHTVWGVGYKFSLDSDSSD